MKRLLTARLFGVVLFSFLHSLLLFVAAMSVSFFLGYRRSAAGWGREKLGNTEGELRRALVELLARRESAGELGRRIDAIVPPGVPLEVYDPDGEVLYARGRRHMMPERGMMHGAGMAGRRGGQPRGTGVGEPGAGGESRQGVGAGREPRVLPFSRGPLERVERGGRLLGYYRMGVPGFGLDSANARFLSSMRKAVWTGAAVSLPLAFVSSLLLSRRLARPARRVAGGIQDMARGNLGARIPEDGAEEIVAIARAANELAGKLGKEEALRRQWAADVAHDLRTPIAALRAQLEGMRDGVLDTSPERVSRNLQEIARIERLVDDLGELTRLESPEMSIRPAPVDPARLCGDLKSRFEPDFAAKGIRTEWSCGVTALVADENLLLRALSNLLSNAVRHTPQGGRISLAFEARGAGGRGAAHAITVHNTGEAIPREEIGKLFQRLYRGEYARKSAGSGLGLTIALKIAELHGGTVEIDSREGFGTSVTLILGRPDRARTHPL